MTKKPSPRFGYCLQVEGEVTAKVRNYLVVMIRKL